MSYIGHYCCDSSTSDLAANKFTIVEITNTNFTASKFIYYSISTSTTAVIATLPTTPENGDWVGFIDRLGTFGTHNLTIDNGPNLIRNNSDDLVVDLNYINFRLVFNNGNWNIFDLSIGVIGGGTIELTQEQYDAIITYLQLNYTFSSAQLTTILNYIIDNIKSPIISASGTINAIKNRYYLIDTTSVVATINLPSSPSDGDWIIISDKNNIFNSTTHAATVKYANLKTIRLNADDFLLDVPGTKIKLVYCASNTNWDVLSFN